MVAPRPPVGSASVWRIVIASLATYVAAVALSLMLALILISVAASALSTALGGTAIGSSSTSSQASQQLSSSDLGTVLHVLTTFTGYVFFASHFTPLEASALGGATYAVIGIGSVTIALVAFLVPFLFARHIEKQMPTQSTAIAVGRGLLIGAPYWVGALALYFPSQISLGNAQFGVSVSPSGFGLVIPALLVAGSGALGAWSIRSVRDPVVTSVVRGLGRATVAVVVGALATALIAGVWLGAQYLTHAPVSSGGSSLSPAARDLGWSLLALVPFYLLNAMGIAWSATLGGVAFSDSPWHVVTYIGPAYGALMGAVQLRQRADRVEQAVFALAFAVGTGLIGAMTTPTIINGPSALPPPWTAVLVALAIGAAAAVVGPYLQSWRPVGAIVTHAPMKWVVGPLLAAWPSETVGPTDFAAGTSDIALPRFRRVHGIVAVALVALVAGGVVANAALSSRFSPDNAAVAYLDAQRRGDVDSVWSMVTYEATSPESTPLLSKAALKEMLTYSNNVNLSNVRVTDSARQDDSNFVVTVELTRSGQGGSLRLHVRKDTSRSNWLIYPFWKVVIAPSNVQITGFTHAGNVTVDGFDVGVSNATGSIEVIPGQHAVDMAQTDIFDGDHQLVDASSDASVTFKATLNAAASTAVRKAIGDLFTHCASAQQIEPSGCPNSTFAFGNHQSAVHWSLVGDPTSGMQLSIADQNDTITASGQWKMHVSFDYWYDFDPGYVQHWDQDVSGSFNDTLHWNGSSFDITSQSGY